MGCGTTRGSVYTVKGADNGITERSGDQPAGWHLPLRIARVRRSGTVWGILGDLHYASTTRRFLLANVTRHRLSAGNLDGVTLKLAQSPRTTPSRTLEPICWLFPPRTWLDYCSVEAVVLPLSTEEYTVHCTYFFGMTAEYVPNKRAHTHVPIELHCWPEMARFPLGCFG